MLLLIDTSPESITIIATIIGAILTVAGWIVLRSERPSEKASRDLQALITNRDTLEKRVESLEKEKEMLSKEVDDCKNVVEEKLKEIASLQSENAQQAAKIILLNANAQEYNSKIESYSSKLLECRTVISFITEQRNEIAKRFNIPQSIAEVKDA